MLQKTWQLPWRNVACPGDLKDLNTVDLVKKSECSVRGITTLQLTEQPSTQILHNMRQCCHRSCCSLGRYSYSSRWNARIYMTHVKSQPYPLMSLWSSNTECSGLDNNGLFMNLLPRKSHREGAVAFSKLIHFSADETDSKDGSKRSTSSYGPHQWNHEYIHVINERRRERWLW